MCEDGPAHTPPNDEHRVSCSSARIPLLNTAEVAPRHLERGRFPLLLALACLTGLGGCDFVEDHLRTCGSLRVDLTNSQQARLPVHLAAETESFSADTLLVSGASRRIVLCVERGDRRAFRALRDGEVIGATTCVVSKARHEYESSIARVIWAPGGFRCENW